MNIILYFRHFNQYRIAFLSLKNLTMKDCNESVIYFHGTLQSDGFHLMYVYLNILPEAYDPICLLKSQRFLIDTFLHILQEESVYCSSNPE